MMGAKLQEAVMGLCAVSVLTALLGFLLPNGNCRKSAQKALALVMLTSIAETLAALFQ